MVRSLSSKEFKKNISVSQSFLDRGMLIKYFNSPNPGVGFIVSRKYGNAVSRNLFKRRCRFVFKSLILDRGHYISLIISPKKSNISYNDIIKTLLSLNSSL